jgi:ATP-binding cassette, subfamily B, bacterial
MSVVEGVRRVLGRLRTPPDPTAGMPEMEQPWWDPHGAEVGTASLRAILRRLPELGREALAVSWRAGRADTVGVLVLNVAAAVVSAFGLLATQPILAALLAGGPTPERVWAALPALLVVGTAIAVQALLSAAAGYCQARLQPLVSAEVTRRLFALTSEVPLAAFDDPGFADEMRRSRDRGVDSAGRLVDATVTVSTGLVHLAAAGSALLVLHPALLAVLLVAAAPRGWAAVRDARRRYASMAARMTLVRRMWLLGDLLADRDTAAELRSNQMRDWLLGRFRALQQLDTAADLRLARLGTTTRLAGDAASGLAATGVYVLLGALLLAGTLPLSAAGTAVLILSNARTSLYTLILSVNTAYAEGLDFADLVAFCRRAAGHLPETSTAVPVGPVAPPAHIRLDGVSFTYPGADRPALTGVSLEVRAGQRIALVGENGSGKTTLAKLLALLYAPTTGTVAWNGAVLDHAHPDRYRDHIAVIAQDHARWPFTAADNIAVGRPDVLATAGTVEAAARAARAHQLITGLTHGYDTLLDKSYRNGADLSGGQWQRLAAARGFYRRPDAALLICDEPSAALDARAEHHLFDAILDHHDHQTVVLITHRLANIRACDHIYVLHDGRITEHGTHPQLMSAAGRYAELFTLQASGYLDPTA